MKKILFAIFIITTLIFSMASCDNPDSEEHDVDDKTTEGDGTESVEGEKDSNNESDEGNDEGENTSDVGSGQSEASFIYSINSNKYHIPTCRYVAAMKEEYRVSFEGTVEEISERGYVPCSNCKPDPDYDYSKSNDSSAGGSLIDEDCGYRYVLNSDSMKFHYSGCSAVKNTNEENKTYSNASRSELVEQGYESCGKCKP